MNVRQTIGWNVRRLRVAKGLSQERLALETGIDRSYVGRVERGSENVTVATLEAMAAVLEVEVKALFDPVETPDSPPPSLPSGRKRKTG
ncbi:helix-turn-helix transcriptional regulator [Mesorhizobium sp. CAU 1741]|uniref:helix-turn-helix domain-containing protein n=1 Tax=Mesorhizobium sp. CAU 1741 TaxID=3140366 RepID=UPI00325AA23B